MQRFFVVVVVFREQIKGNAEGELNIGVVNAGLKASLNKLSEDCNDASEISIKYYATDLPDKLPTTLEGLVELIENFPSRLMGINDGKGVPLQVRIQYTEVTQHIWHFVILFIRYHH